jgi:hypothetical protein
MGIGVKRTGGDEVGSNEVRIKAKDKRRNSYTEVHRDTEVAEKRGDKRR